MSNKNNLLTLDHIHTNNNSGMLRAMSVWNRGSQNVEIVPDVRKVVAFNMHKIFIYPRFVCRRFMFYIRAYIFAYIAEILRRNHEFLKLSQQ